MINHAILKSEKFCAKTLCARSRWWDRDGMDSPGVLWGGSFKVLWHIGDFCQPSGLPVHTDRVALFWWLPADESITTSDLFFSDFGAMEEEVSKDGVTIYSSVLQKSKRFTRWVSTPLLLYPNVWASMIKASNWISTLKCSKAFRTKAFGGSSFRFLC